MPLYVVRNFTPVWFAAIMGTGAISILAQNFPYGNGLPFFKIFTLTTFFLNLCLFVLFTSITAARYIMFPGIWSSTINHPVQSLYLGCFPMGATTLINIAVQTVYEDYNFGGRSLLYTIWGLWWLDCFISWLCVFGLMHTMTTRHEHSLEMMQPTWLLPVVTFIVASSSGGVLAAPLQECSPSHALITIVVSMFMVSIGLSLSLMLLTVYILRLMIYGYPRGATIMSAFVPLGPTGQAGYSILLIGNNIKSVLPMTYNQSEILNLNKTGDTIQVLCLCISLVLWSLATMWLCFSLLGIQEVVRESRFPFTLSFWGIVFPNGVYANHSIQLSIILDSQFFRAFGAFYSIITLILWICVSARTVMLLRNQRIFEAGDTDGMMYNFRAEKRAESRSQSRSRGSELKV